MRRNLTWLILAVIVVGGCGENDPFDPERPLRDPASQVGGQLAPVDEEGESIVSPPPPPPPAPVPPQESVQPDEPTPPGAEREEVHPGVTGKGEGLGSGLISTPLRVYFGIRERLVFTVLIPQAMDLYKGEHGYFPKSHEEFMEEIIAANAINLPALRSADDRYVYDPEKAAGQSQYDADDPPLLIEHPE